jgi:thymidylate synthase
MQAYQDMIREVLSFGTRKENRTAVDTISTFNHNYELCWDPDMYGYRSMKPLAHDNRHIIGSPKDANPVIPMLTTKNVSWKNIVAEMLWFLSGEIDISILERHGCKFWDAWVDAEGKVPSAYGNFWRRFPVHMTDEQVAKLDAEDPHGFYPSLMFNDQLKWALDELRRNPMSRRVVVSAWAPGNAQTSKLPPCHMVFAFNVQNVEETLENRIDRAMKNPDALPADLRTRLTNNGWHKDTPDGRRLLDNALRVGGFPPKTEQRLCLHLTQRSCDLALGVPYNMASYGLLLLIFSHLTGIKPGIFAHTLLDLHIYTGKPDGSMAEYDHIPGLKEQLERAPRALPRLVIDPSIKELSDIEKLMAPEVTTEEIVEKFKLLDYNPHPAIKFKVAV